LWLVAALSALAVHSDMNPSLSLTGAFVVCHILSRVSRYK
jgi:hypothetical protein